MSEKIYPDTESGIEEFLDDTFDELFPTPPNAQAERREEATKVENESMSTPLVKVDAGSNPGAGCIEAWAVRSELGIETPWINGELQLRWRPFQQIVETREEAEREVRDQGNSARFRNISEPIKLVPETELEELKNAVRFLEGCSYESIFDLCNDILTGGVADAEDKAHAKVLQKCWEE